MDTEVQVADRPDQAQCEARLDGAVVGIAAYRLGNDQITLHHTEVDPAHRGRGIGEALARFALDDARQRGLLVLPTCSFIRSFIEEHPDYAHLVADTPPA